MAKFINPFTDLGFKRIFGQEVSKPVLIAFLNSLLEGEHHILDLKFLDKEQPGDAVEALSGASKAIGTLVMNWPTEEERDARMADVTAWVKVLTE